MNAYGDRVVLLQAPLVSGYGGRMVRDWPNATRTSVSAAVQPLSTREIELGRQVAITDKSLHAPASSGITAEDRVEWGGETWRLEGDPEVHYMGGVPDHVEAHLVQVTGTE